LVHYSGGLVSLASFAAAAEMPHSSLIWLGARVLLDLAGGLFGLYFVVMFGLYLAGCVMRLRHRVPARRSGPGV
jgi:hypothetical protein